MANLRNPGTHACFYCGKPADRTWKGHLSCRACARPADCRNCGGDGWLPSLPEGRSTCPACRGTGKETS